MKIKKTECEGKVKYSGQHLLKQEVPHDHLQIALKSEQHKFKGLVQKNCFKLRKAL